MMRRLRIARGRLVFALMVLTALALSIPDARAQHDGMSGSERRRVVVIGHADDALAARLRDELALAGFDVRVVPPSDVEPADLLEDHDADALARARGAQRDVRLWFRSEGPIDEAMDLTSDRGGAAGERLLVLRAVEVIRGLLIPVAPVAPVSAAAPELAAPPNAPPAPAENARGGMEPGRVEPPERAGPRPFVSVSAGPSVLVLSGGLPPVPQIRVGASFRVIDRIAIEPYVLVPTMASELLVDEGSVSARVVLTGVALAVVLSPPEHPARATAYAGAGPSAIVYAGEPIAPYAGVSAAAPAFVPYAGAAGSYRFLRWLGVRLDAQASFLLPPHVLVAAGREIGEVGPVAGSFTLSLEAHP